MYVNVVGRYVENGKKYSILDAGNGKTKTVDERILDLFCEKFLIRQHVSVK